jgi:NAD-dependent dihydropyrimidine dehydrogenase PreA subunit
MAKRTIIEVNQDLCDGCGACEIGCPEGALKVIGGKARLVGESLCDGLGACIGHCPRGAIRVTQRDADSYDEVAVLDKIIPQGAAVLQAHFAHLDHFGQDLYIEQAIEKLDSLGIDVPQGFEKFRKPAQPKFEKPCPSFSRTLATMAALTGSVSDQPGSTPTEASTPPTLTRTSPSIIYKNLAPKAAKIPKPRNWPVQLHLINPRAPLFANAKLLVAADCTAFVMDDFHTTLADEKSLVIACPKLDSGRDIYVSKLAALISQAESVEAAIMDVPCCNGLARLLEEARQKSERPLPINLVVVSSEGKILGKKTL